VLDGDAWSNEPQSEAEEPTTNKPATEAGTIARGRRDIPVRVGVGFGIECWAAHKPTDKGDTSQKLVERSTRLRPRPDDGAC
jgi:hypothetical protein